MMKFRYPGRSVFVKKNEKKREQSIQLPQFIRYVESEKIFATALRTIHYGDEKVPFHIHPDFYELGIILYGDGFHQLGENEPIRIFPGYTFLLEPGCRHSYIDFSHLMVLNLLFIKKALSNMEPILKDLPGFCMLFSGNESAKEILTVDAETVSSVNIQMGNMMSEQAKKEPGYELEINLTFQKILLEICRRCHRVSDEKPKKLRLIQILDYMSRNLDQDLNLEKLASLTRMSMTNFRRSFREMTGFSPIHYLIKLRIERAGELLLHPDLTVKEAAERSGFHDLSYFSKQFFRIMQTTPHEWRKNPHGLQYMPGLDKKEGMEFFDRPINYRLK